ncbi:MAG: DUF4160 domain-containing protein [Bacteroidales bacterium]|jgi:hypothetical protein|nr:DUF4160 domain-containing protein [Bacteroidales bacterium]
MPTIIFLFGLRFFFYSEEHLPIHIHVQNGDGRAKIMVETGEIAENNGIKPKDIKKATEIVDQYRDDIIKAWNEYFDE